MKTKGFTLVELLVVIAILAILATVSVVGYTSFISDSNDKATLSEAADIHNGILNACTLNTAGVVVEVGENNATKVVCKLNLTGTGYTITDYVEADHESLTVVTDIIGKATAAKLTYATGTLTYTNRDFSYTLTGSAAPAKAEE